LLDQLSAGSYIHQLDLQSLCSKHARVFGDQPGPSDWIGISNGGDLDNIGSARRYQRVSCAAYGAKKDTGQE
jgi:hypothetical protein